MTNSVAVAPPTTIGASAGTRPAGEIMRRGVVVVNADASVREVARTMRDHRVTALLAIDLSGEAVGLVSQADLLKGWGAPDSITALEVMNDDPPIVDPASPVGEAARSMLAAGASEVLVAAPRPTEESGRWSEWKERGLPLGTLGVSDMLARLDDLESAVRGAGRRANADTGQRQFVPIAVAVATIFLVLLVLALLIVGYAGGTHHLTNRPGL